MRRKTTSIIGVRSVNVSVELDGLHPACPMIGLRTRKVDERGRREAEERERFRHCHVLLVIFAFFSPFFVETAACGPRG